ncbi:MAG: hypothetical protein GXO23_05725 [Crenarchaeota archaeon]|nr:hypothetical protein [Thermoproteota archaeon]
MSRRVPVVIYDTSILILMMREKVKIVDMIRDIVGTHVAAVPELTVRELEKLSRSRERRTRVAASLALEIVRKYMSILKCVERYCDECILSSCKRGLIDYVVTCDIGLKRRIEQDMSCKVLYYLESKRRIVGDVE